MCAAACRGARETLPNLGLWPEVKHRGKDLQLRNHGKCLGVEVKKQGENCDLSLRSELTNSVRLAET